MPGQHRYGICVNPHCLHEGEEREIVGTAGLCDTCYRRNNKAVNTAPEAAEERRIARENTQIRKADELRLKTVIGIFSMLNKARNVLPKSEILIIHATLGHHLHDQAKDFAQDRRDAIAAGLLPAQAEDGEESTPDDDEEMPYLPVESTPEDGVEVPRPIRSLPPTGLESAPKQGVESAPEKSADVPHPVQPDVPSVGCTPEQGVDIPHLQPTPADPKQPEPESKPEPDSTIIQLSPIIVPGAPAIIRAIHRASMDSAQLIRFGEGLAVTYVKTWTAPADWYERLIAELALSPEQVKMYGRDLTIERETAMYGEPYHFNPLSKEALPWEASPAISELRQMAEETTHHKYSQCACNLYQDGGVGIGVHHDKHNPTTIVSISFGPGEREMGFCLHKEPGADKPNTAVDETLPIIRLAAGSLIMFNHDFNVKYKHEIIKNNSITKPRLSVTLREFLYRGLR